MIVKEIKVVHEANCKIPSGNYKVDVNGRDLPVKDLFRYVETFYPLFLHRCFYFFFLSLHIV